MTTSIGLFTTGARHQTIKFITGIHIMSNATVKWYGIDLSHALPIIGSHITRIGLFRVIIGGGAMYLSIPNFIILHLLFVFLLFQIILTPLLSLKHIPLYDRIIIDRYRIKGLSWIDKFNCVFCGYANGVSIILDEKLDQISSLDAEPSLYKKVIFIIMIVVLAPIFIFIHITGITIIYNILISKSLGMRRLTPREAWSNFDADNYGSKFGNFTKNAVCFMKYFSIHQLNALEQIESSWCPLKHFDNRPEVKYPPHHNKFYNHDEIEQMRDTLLNTGTVSSKHPHNK